MLPCFFHKTLPKKIFPHKFSLQSLPSRQKTTVAEFHIIPITQCCYHSSNASNNYNNNYNNNDNNNDSRRYNVVAALVPSPTQP